MTNHRCPRRSGIPSQNICSRPDIFGDRSIHRCPAETKTVTGTKTGTGMAHTPDACQLREELMSLYFVMVELELYLDGHPNSTEALKRYQCTVAEFKEVLSHYEKHFGPLFARNNDCEKEWRWVKTPWPWEV